MSDGSSIIPLDQEHPDHPDNLARRLQEEKHRSRFNPGSREDYSIIYPDEDSGDHVKQFAAMIDGRNGRYVMTRDSTWGELIGRIESVGNFNGTEFVLQTGERIFHCVRYDQVIYVGARETAA